MGLIRAALTATRGVLQDQWKEYFYCDAMDSDILVMRGFKRGTKRGNKGSDNIISSGSVIAVADGQCMIIVEQGKVVELCAQPGEYTYDASTEPSIFSGDLSSGIKEVFNQIGKRFTFGGEAPKDQRVYYFNTKELYGNKYGTPNAIPFRVVDQRAGIDMDVGLRCFGEYSYRLTNPILFYTNVCGNVEQAFERSRLDGQLKSELLTALQPAFAKISEMGIRYSALPGHTEELSRTLDDILSEKWTKLRGIDLISLGVSSVKVDEEDERILKELQKNAAYTNPALANAAMTGAMADSMRMAAGNSAGAAVGFMGMNLAGGANMGNMYAANAQAMQNAPAANGWSCTCGKTGNTGKFCSECGAPKPAPAGSWKCSCGAENTGKFCSECGKPRPTGKCPRCGWQSGDGSTPKFCPECGSSMA